MSFRVLIATVRIRKVLLCVVIDIYSVHKILLHFFLTHQLDFHFVSFPLDC